LYPKDASVKPTTIINGDDEAMLTTSGVRQRYGGVSHMWIERQLKDPASNFPRPFFVAARRLWRLGELRAWEATLPRESPPELLEASQVAMAKRKRGRPPRPAGV
jgi:hypothetical protein